MQELKRSINALSVNFLLSASKQHALVYVLKKFSIITPAELAQSLNISEKKLNDVLEKRGFLNNTQAKQLMEYFFIWCSGS